MQLVAVLVGFAIVVGTLLEVFVTTVSMRGAGPVTSRFTNLLWRAVATRGKVGHRSLEMFGSFLVPLVVALWTVLLYLGWSLVFSGEPGAVVSASTGAPASLLERVYFTGYTISTLGNGELRPGEGLWQIFTVLASLSGLTLITLAITYVAPVLDAVVRKRQVARVIHGYGKTTEDALRQGWDGQSFDRMTTHLANLAPELAGLAQQHMAYPILHYFHSADRNSALAPAVAVLDEAVALIGYGVAPAHRLDPITHGSIVAALNNLLEALAVAHISPVDGPMDPPDVACLDRLGIPRVDNDTWRAGSAGLGERRALMQAFLHSDGWDGSRSPAGDAPNLPTG